MPYRLQYRVLLLFLLGLRAFSPLGANEIRVVGTDLLGVEFSRALHQFAGENNFRLNLAFDGSRPARDALLARNADVALLTLPAREEVFDPAFRVTAVAYHRVLVLAPAASPLERITFAELENIFGDAAMATAPRINVETPPERFAPPTLVPVVPEVGVGVGAEYFRHAVLRGGGFKPRVVRYRDLGALGRHFEGERPVLALATALPAQAMRMKMVAVARKTGEPAFLPTPENLHGGDYPLALPVRLVFRVEALARLRPLLCFVAGHGAAPHFERAGVVPLPAALRAQQLEALAKM